jgi:hypothetical protein
MSDPDPSKSNTVLAIGLHPRAVDYSRYPGLDEPTLTSALDATAAEIRQAGFDYVWCLVPASPDEAEKQVHASVADSEIGLALIGAGIRMAPERTLLFERLVNVVNDILPGVPLCFNESPETTIDALRRWLSPA